MAQLPESNMPQFDDSSIIDLFDSAENESKYICRHPKCGKESTSPCLYGVCDFKFCDIHSKHEHYKCDNCINYACGIFKDVFPVCHLQNCSRELQKYKKCRTCGGYSKTEYNYCVNCAGLHIDNKRKGMAGSSG